MAKIDELYNSIVIDIIENGYSNEGEKVRTVYADGTPAYTKSIMSAQLKFDNSEPAILTTKQVGWKTAIKEILLFWQQKTNRLSVMQGQGVRIWDEWEIKEGKWNGTIGSSYGYQLGKKVRELNGEKVDQVDYLLHELKHNPYSRRHVTSLWNIDDLDEMALNPCVWNTQWLVRGNELHLIVGQRSGDVALGIPFNLLQYQVLQMMIAQVTGYKVGSLTFNVSDAHIYDRHLDLMEKQVNGETFEAPYLWMNPNVTNFYDFTIEDFKLAGYKNGGKFEYEVAI